MWGGNAFHPLCLSAAPLFRWKLPHFALEPDSSSLSSDTHTLPARSWPMQWMRPTLRRAAQRTRMMPMR